MYYNIELHTDMKKIVFLPLFIVLSFLFSSCSNDENSLSGTVWAPMEDLDGCIQRYKEALEAYYDNINQGKPNDGIPYLRIPYNIIVKFEGINTLVIYGLKTEDKSYELNYVSSGKYIINDNIIKANIVLDNIGEIEINARIEGNLMNFEWGQDANAYKLYRQ